MTAQQLIEKVVEAAAANKGWTVLILLSCIEIAPVKINPWSMILKPFFKKVGVWINGDVLQRIDGLDKQVKKIKDKQDEMERVEDERNAIAARIRILRFCSELRKNERVTFEHFNDVLRDITEYEYYCDTHKGFKNDQAKQSIDYIHKRWAECSDSDFL